MAIHDSELLRAANEAAQEAPVTPEIVHAPESAEDLAEAARETVFQIAADANAERDRFAATVRGAVERIGAEPTAGDALVATQQAEVVALEQFATAAVASASGGEQREAEPRPRAGLWDRAIADLPDRRVRIDALRADTALSERYAGGAVNEKFGKCAANVDACVGALLVRREATNRPLDGEATRARVAEMLAAGAREQQAGNVKKLRGQLAGLRARVQIGRGAADADARIAALEADVQRAEEKLAMMPEGRAPENDREAVLLEEVTQEYALSAWDQKREQGIVDIALLDADMVSELQLDQREAQEANSVEHALELVAVELREYEAYGFLTEREAQLIREHSATYAGAFTRAFEQKFGAHTAQQVYEVIRDNARKMTYQTLTDKRAFSGSDHGTRHICEGCTHFSEQIMASLGALEGVDFQPQDEVLIRQAIVDHDIGYAMIAAQAKGGFEAAKDHPCVGCKYIEEHADYYTEKFGKQGYEVIRDVVLNHSYAQSEYGGARPPPTEDDPVTYNRDLIRSVVSTVDAMGVTSETKAMDFFRHPEAIDVLQNVRLYAETHGGKVDGEALVRFKEDLAIIAENLAAEGRVSAERAAGYRSAIEKHFNAMTVDITLGQFTGVVREMRLTARADGRVVPEIQMDLSQVAALVGELFGDPNSIKGFAKAMEDFGVDRGKLKEFAETAKQLRNVTDPEERERLLGQLRFESERATFVIGQRETLGIGDERDSEIAAIQQRFEMFRTETIRGELRGLFERIRSAPEHERQGIALTIGDELQALLRVGEGTEGARLLTLAGLVVEHANDPTALEALQGEVSTFLSDSERARLARRPERAARASP